MSPKERQFVCGLLTKAETHADWLMIIRFGWDKLRNDTEFVFELIVEEAGRRLQQENIGTHLASVIKTIFDELGIKLVVEPTVNLRTPSMPTSAPRGAASGD